MKNLMMLVNVISAHKRQKIEGRIRLQKTIFLLKHLGLPFEERYKYLHYGPYSEGLSYEIKELKKYNLITETGGPPHGPYFYKIEPSGKKVLKSFQDAKLEKKIRELVGIIENYDPRTLELLSTVYYIKNAGYTSKEAWKSLRELKPDRVNDKSLKSSKELHKQLKNRFCK